MPRAIRLPLHPDAESTKSIPRPSGRFDHDPMVDAPVALLEASRENKLLMPELLNACQRVLQSGRMILGSEVAALEQEVARISGTEFAVGCASGSDALLLAMMAIDLKPGDEVILPSFTFFATASAVWRLGARPVFVDIDPQTFCISADLVERLISSRTRAIIPVHLFGYAVDMQPIMSLANRHQLWVIEDVAQAIGAVCRERPAGSWGDMGCLSFYPTKNLGGFGDGGMLTTRSADFADRLQLLRGHGMRPRYSHSRIGINSRLDELQAALLRVKVPLLARHTAQRRANAVSYEELFHEAGLDACLGLPSSDTTERHVWNQYTIRVLDQRRDRLREHLAKQQIDSEVYYPLPLHQQECFASLGYCEGSLPVTEAMATQVLSLPIHPFLTIKDQVRVVNSIAQYFAQSSQRLVA